MSGHDAFRDTSIDVFCDGSFRPPFAGGWGVCLFSRAGAFPMRQFFGAAVVTTSFEAELLAALEGLRRVPDGAHVTLYTDCAQIREGFGALQARAEAASVLKVKPLRSRERRKANPTLLAATRERMAALWKAVWKELKRLAGVKVRNAKARPEGLGVAHQLSRRGSAQCETLLRRGTLSQPALSSLPWLTPVST